MAHRRSRWPFVASLLIASATPGIAQVQTSPAPANIERLRLRLEDLVARVDRQTTVSTASLARELHERRQQLAEAVRLSLTTPGTDLAELRAIVDSLEAQLVVREDENADLQRAVATLTLEMEALREVHQTDALAAERADSLTATAEATARELELWTVGEFYGHVRAWADLGTTLQAISATARTLLLFPEAGDRRLDTALRTVGGLGTLGGALVAARDARVGASTSGLSMLVALVPGWLGSRRTPELVENVARNRSFTDDVQAFARIADPFADRAAALQVALPDPAIARRSGIPRPLLAQYFGLISRRRDLGVVLRQMKAKAEVLASLEGVTESGRRGLDDLIESYEQALAQWESSELAYASTYQYLIDRVEERERTAEAR
ncbi:MAG: hypothetical protein R3E10_09015 [Gemmatimonadota bacterium]